MQRHKEWKNEAERMQEVGLEQDLPRYFTVVKHNFFRFGLFNVTVIQKVHMQPFQSKTRPGTGTQLFGRTSRLQWFSLKCSPWVRFTQNSQKIFGSTHKIVTSGTANQRRRNSFLLKRQTDLFYERFFYRCRHQNRSSKRTVFAL